MSLADTAKAVGRLAATGDTDSTELSLEDIARFVRAVAALEAEVTTATQAVIEMARGRSAAIAERDRLAARVVALERLYRAVVWHRSARRDTEEWEQAEAALVEALDAARAAGG